MQNTLLPMKSLKDQSSKPHFDSRETDEAGFQSVIPSGHYQLLNDDGTFNITRKGAIRPSMFENLIMMSWRNLFVRSLLFYFLSNAVFALGFMWIGPENISGVKLGNWWEEYLQCLQFSIQTFTTVGYGQMAPMGIMTNILASLVAFVGLLSFALATGLFYGKFSKPISNIAFSKNMIIGPDKNGNKSLQFRIVNMNDNHIIDVEARVTLAWLEEINGMMRRRFKWLDLEIENIHLFPLNWTIVHPINEDSPMYNLTKEKMRESQMEVLILIQGYDDTYSQTIHSRRSYNCSQLVENVQFVPMYKSEKGQTILDLTMLDEYVPYSFS